MNRFIFKEYKFSPHNGMASFSYAFEGGLEFEERVFFEVRPGYDTDVLDKALFLAFILTGVSYYKTFPSHEVIVEHGQIDAWQSEFFNKVFQDGLSQFAFENSLSREDLAKFKATAGDNSESLPYNGQGILSLQSGGKDSILTAVLLKKRGHIFKPWYLSSGATHPEVLNNLSDERLVVSKRVLDIDALNDAKSIGAKNGHVPVTYIVQSFALIQAILLHRNTVLTAIAHEGEEPHEMIDDMPVNHQWSKTWEAERLFNDYVSRYISKSIRVGSPLRGYSELRVAELFYDHAWSDYADSFSSCNVANYTQGQSNSQLKWCGDCPKCANSYLLFAPFAEADELKQIFGGKDLFAKESLQDTFKGLLGVAGFMKPFECVGEVAELRYAYHLAKERGVFEELSFRVPKARFDYKKRYDSQASLRELVV